MSHSFVGVLLRMGGTWIIPSVNSVLENKLVSMSHSLVGVLLWMGGTWRVFFFIVVNFEICIPSFLPVRCSMLSNFLRIDVFSWALAISGCYIDGCLTDWQVVSISGQGNDAW